MYKLRNNYGFTLIEIVVALAVIAIGIFAIMTLTLMVVKGNAHSRKNTAATTLAQKKMEEIKALNFASIVGGAGCENCDEFITTGCTPIPTPTPCQFNDDYKAYARETIISLNEPAANMITSKVSVYWKPGSHTVNLTTIISNNE